MRQRQKTYQTIACLLGLLVTCTSPDKAPFVYLSPSETGIDFQNTIIESDTFNILNFHYLYNGGGVGLGDFNQDGLIDLVLTGNQVASKIYLNRGNMHFEDISKTSGFTHYDWSTGVSLVDINQDGLLDIYVSTGGIDCSKACANLLYVNQGQDEKGIPHFQEEAAKYNLEDKGYYTQQAAFLDFDKDGDLDVYLLHNVIDPRDKNAPSPKRYINKASQDQLLENQNGIFRNVSDSMGITHRGYGLGIIIHDFNQDGSPDIYVANDFLSDDLLYINQASGKDSSQGFKECSQTYLKHQSYNSMGVDVADVNQDALPDILVVDMLPAYNERQKTMLGFMNYNKFILSQKEGYAPQFVRNTLQIHNGFLGDTLLAFSELGNLAGVTRTDWSWAPLLVDLDNDGDRDLYISNGYGKDITDLDFINYSQQLNTFGTAADLKRRLFQALGSMEPISIPNYIYENRNELKFRDQSGVWMEKVNSISNGAAYADLDNDGDLDLVSNNINDYPFIIENKSPHLPCIKIKLEGTEQNKQAIGSQVWIWHDAKVQTQYVNPVKGYLSSMQTPIHFGLGSSKQVDSLKITWPDGSQTIRYKLQANQTLELKARNSQAFIPPQKEDLPLFQEILEDKTNYQHQEDTYVDFSMQRLLIRQYSRLGPCLEAENIDKKEGDEIFIGGASGHSSCILSEQVDGSYQPTWLHDSTAEVSDAHFVDIDGDADMDLYLAKGGVESGKKGGHYQDIIYLNDGKGNFEANSDVLPPMPTSSSKVISLDVDQDGDLDLFVAGRISPNQYPRLPRSYLLENKEGVFQDITPHKLRNVGMVSDALVSDVNQDNWPDLVLIGEWMPIRIFVNHQGKLEATDIPALAETAGLWNCLAQGDFDKDGDPDFILGNLGLNTRLNASAQEPLVLYKLDKDKNGSLDPLIGRFFPNIQGQRDLYPLHSRDDIMLQIPSLKKQFNRYLDFGRATLEDILSEPLNHENSWRVDELASVYLENKGNLHWAVHKLPLSCQWAPVQSILVHDFNEDKNLDALLLGNDYTSESTGGWQDAFSGIYLEGDGKGNFKTIHSAQSGFYTPGDNRDLCLVSNRAQETSVWVGKNRGKLQIYRFNHYKPINK